jgi:predicted nucleotidyltransferase
MTEEAGEPERLEAVVPVQVGGGGIPVQQLKQAFRLAAGRRLEDIQLRLSCAELRDPVGFSSVEGFEELGDTSSVRNTIELG